MKRRKRRRRYGWKRNPARAVCAASCPPRLRLFHFPASAADGDVARPARLRRAFAFAQRSSHGMLPALPMVSAPQACADSKSAEHRCCLNLLRVFQFGARNPFLSIGPPLPRHRIRRTTCAAPRRRRCDVFEPLRWRPMAFPRPDVIVMPREMPVPGKLSCSTPVLP